MRHEIVIVECLFENVIKQLFNFSPANCWNV